MKWSTVWKAGTLAMDIFNHQSTQQLSGLVRSGIKRRTAHPPQKAPEQRLAYRQARTLPPLRAHPSPPPAPDPFVPIKKAMKYVTPDNLQKAAEWHGIIKSLIAKE